MSGLMKVVPVKWRGSKKDSPAARVHPQRRSGGFAAQSRTFCRQGFINTFGIDVPQRTTTYAVLAIEVE